MQDDQAVQGTVLLLGGEMVDDVLHDGLAGEIGLQVALGLMWRTIGYDVMVCLSSGGLKGCGENGFD